MRKRSTLKKVLNRIKKYWIYLVFSILAAAVSVISTLYFPILTGNVIDHIIAKGLVDFAGVFAILKKMTVVVAATAISQWIMNVCNNKLTFSVVRDMRDAAIEKIQILLISWGVLFICLLGPFGPL